MTHTMNKNKHGIWPDPIAQKASDYFQVPLSEVTSGMRNKMKIMPHAQNYSTGGRKKLAKRGSLA